MTQPKDKGNRHTAQNISQRDGKQVPKQEILPGKRGQVQPRPGSQLGISRDAPRKKARRDIKHICDAVLKTTDYKKGDRQIGA